MALTITNDLIRSADTPHGRARRRMDRDVATRPVLTEGQAAAREIAGAGQIPAGCGPGVHDEGFWSRADARAGEFGVTGPAAHIQASGVAGAG
jgi:hypothetical protein